MTVDSLYNALLIAEDDDDFLLTDHEQEFITRVKSTNGTALHRLPAMRQASVIYERYREETGFLKGL